MNSIGIGILNFFLIFLMKSVGDISINPLSKKIPRPLNAKVVLTILINYTLKNNTNGNNIFKLV